MPGRLKGKAALVSGGARGIGAAVARLFVREGANILLGDIFDQEGRRAAAELTHEPSCFRSWP